MGDLRQRTCCFTGHRELREEDLPAILKRTEQVVRRLIEKGVVFFGVGGAIGYDTEVAKLLFRLRATDDPKIKVILVYPFEGFTRRWSDAQRAEYAPDYSPSTIRPSAWLREPAERHIWKGTGTSWMVQTTASPIAIAIAVGRPIRCFRVLSRIILIKLGPCFILFLTDTLIMGGT